jgi:hypothetical protein
LNIVSIEQSGAWVVGREKADAWELENPLRKFASPFAHLAHA